MTCWKAQIISDKSFKVSVCLKQVLCKGSCMQPYIWKYLVFSYLGFIPEKPVVLEDLLFLPRQYTPGCTGSQAGMVIQTWIHAFTFPFPANPRIDEDHERFPRLIADAECRHSRCVTPEGQLDHGLNSVPITQEILVLRREQRGCQQSYRLEKKLITVGCTCVTPLVQHQAWREMEVQEQGATENLLVWKGPDAAPKMLNQATKISQDTSECIEN